MSICNHLNLKNIYVLCWKTLIIATVIFEHFFFCNCAQFLNARHCDKPQNTYFSRTKLSPIFENKMWLIFLKNFEVICYFHECESRFESESGLIMWLDHLSDTRNENSTAYFSYCVKLSNLMWKSDLYFVFSTKPLLLQK